MKMRRGLLKIEGLILSVLLLAGCSPVTKDKMLRIFFDGVRSKDELKKASSNNQPNPSVMPDNAVTGQAAKPPEPVIYRHPPYADGECKFCHQDKVSMKLIAKGKDLCFICHDDFLKGAKVKHYPAEEGMCLECHNPHKSPNKHLLIRKGQDVCLYCHDDMLKQESHKDIGKEECTSCHDPHKGDDKLLK